MSYVVGDVVYESKAFYDQMQVKNAKVLAMVAEHPEKYPPCTSTWNEWTSEYQLQHDVEGCDCPRAEIIYLNFLGCPQDVSVSIAAIGHATQIRQYDFDGHDTSFDDFQDKFVDLDGDYPGDPEMVKRYTQWVAENQPAVQWAIDFSRLREYLGR